VDRLTKEVRGQDAAKEALSQTTKKGATYEEEVVVTSPTSSKVLETCERFGLVLLIDELHKASDSFAEELANFLKAYGNANCRAFKVILLGTASVMSQAQLELEVAVSAVSS